MKRQCKDHINPKEMMNKLGLNKRNSFLDSVIWRNWIVPIFISLVVSIIARVAFHYIPENTLTNEFFAGWISCVAYSYAYKRYAI